MAGLVSTYALINNHRAAIKRQINDKIGSKIVEEKKLYKPQRLETQFEINPEKVRLRELLQTMLTTYVE